MCFKAASATPSSTKVSSHRGLALRKYLNCSHEQCPKLLSSCFWELMKMERSVSQVQGFLQFEFFMVWVYVCGVGGMERGKRERGGRRGETEHSSEEEPLPSYHLLTTISFPMLFLIIPCHFHFLSQYNDPNCIWQVKEACLLLPQSIPLYT